MFTWKVLYDPYWMKKRQTIVSRNTRKHGNRSRICISISGVQVLKQTTTLPDIGIWLSSCAC